MRILVVEDDKKIADSIKRGLEQQKYAVDVAYNGNDGETLANEDTYDLVILDRMLPGKEGLEILRQIRKNNIQTPVLLLTAKDHVLERAAGLNAGADDYLVKPFAFVELIARVRALLRRPQDVASATLTYEDLKLDLEAFSVFRGDQKIKLTSKEFALLEYFMRNPDRVLTKDAITQHVWDYDADILPNTVEVYVGYLRGKVDKPFKNTSKLIHTKRGFGYYFGAEDV
jgi:DNA-binding response OmpR family regulator